MKYRILSLQDVSKDQIALWLTEVDQEKRQRIERFRREEDRLRCLCADHLARQMLSELMNIPRCRLNFAKDRRGKPYLKETADIHFNLSHAGNYAICAIDSHPVGVDIEVPRFVRPELCNKVCTAEELEFVHPDGIFSPERFLQLWTAKEAFLKQSGVGIMQDLTAISLVRNGVLSYPAPLTGLFRQEAEYCLAIAYKE